MNFNLDKSTGSAPHFIIEVANAHGGNFKYLLDLIKAFNEYGDGFSMKFQPFHFDKIATKDFSAYKLYQQLHFDKNQWKTVIDMVADTKGVWLDIFDTYGVEVLLDNIDRVVGIKFQSSVLYNFEVFKALLVADLRQKKIILNVAAQTIQNIREVIEYITLKLKPLEILLEFGYQAYPTRFEDSGFSKIEIIKANFKNRIVFADHVDGKTVDAVWLPVMVALTDVDVIEKHVMLDDRDTLFDQFSSLTPSKFSEMVSQIKRYTSLKGMPFINDKELTYLNSTMMIPILKHNKPAGSLLNFQDDFCYKRSGKNGLNVKQIESLQNDFHILARDKEAGTTVQMEDLKKATIATIIACRLKSTRLPRKALIPIGDLSSVERCIKSCLEFKDVNLTILATSDLPEDAELENYTYSPNVIFHKGDPEDVIRRYLSIAENLKIDVIVRVTADNPFVSGLIVEQALKAHFTAGADYTVPRRAAIGTGTEIINTAALQKVKRHFTSANYSEYMTWYFQNNPEHFRLNFIDLPDQLIRNYRLTLDYPEDLEMYNKLQGYFDDNNKEFNVVEAFEFLDTHPEISQLNSHLTQRYKADANLIEILNKETKII